ncbi:YqhA family protein, partial [Vibrio anguillarum]
MENIVEKLLYSARWIMAPIYLGLSLVLLALGIKFFQEVFHLLPNILSTDEVSLILVTLSLIDISLVGGLIVM